MNDQPKELDPADGQLSRRAQQADRPRLGRAIGLTALGAFLPGAGLTRTRPRAARVAGWVLLGLALAMVAFIAWRVLSLGATRSALQLASDPNTLRIVSVMAVVGGVVWCASIVLTAVLTRPSGPGRRPSAVLAVLATVLVLAVGAGAFKAAQYAAITRDTISEVFKPSQPTGDPAANGSGAVVVQGNDPWADTPRVNVLLLGSDAGVGRDDTRTDSMIVASIDTKSGRTVLISLPRNLELAPLPEKSPLRALYPSGFFGRPTCLRGAHECLLNAIWKQADEFRKDHPTAYPGVQVPGRYEVRNVISEVTGLRIDNTVVIDLKGFEQLVNAMGGVDVNVKLSGYGAKLPIGGKINESTGTLSGVNGYFTPGQQHLDGYHALWYARTRAGDDDFYRQDRQRCVVRALVNQVNPTSMLARYPDLARIAKDNIYTDIPGSSLAAFVDLIERVQNAKITSVSLSPETGVQSGNPDYDRIRSMVKKGIAASTASPKKSPAPSGASASPTGVTPKPVGPQAGTADSTSYAQC